MMKMVTATGPSTIRKQSTTSTPILESDSSYSPLASDTEFFMALKRSISDGIRDAMGPQILAMLQDRGFLDNPAEASKLHSQLSVLFGNGTSVLEKIIIKELFRKLNLTYDYSQPFDYERSLLWARRVCTTGGQLD